MLKADFHIHTCNSPCSNMKPETVVRTAISKGYEVIGVVDHNNVKGGRLVKKIAGKRLLVIPGEEIKTDAGDIIVFLSDGKYNRNLVNICDRAKRLNHFVVVPHPFDFLRYGASLKGSLDIIKDKVDAIEIFNSRIVVRRFNEMAKEYAKKNGIARIAGSDAHFPEEIGNVSVYLDCKRNVNSVLNCLRKNKIRFKGKGAGILSHVKSTIVKCM
jgi:predicted metal-dependent phosphoesterase TrpH